MKKKLLRKFTLPWWGSLLAFLAASGAVTLLTLWCQPNALRAVLSDFLSQPLLIVLNYLPIALLMLFFAFLFQNVFYGAALTNAVTCILGLVNRVKIQLRGEPLFPRDFGLLREAGDAMQSYHINYPIQQILIVVLATAALILFGAFLKNKPISFFKRKTPMENGKRCRHWAERLLCAAGSAAVLVALIFTLYASDSLYKSFYVSDNYYIPAAFNELGFPYCFCHQFASYPVDEPEGFSKSEAASWETGEKTNLGKQVHVVMVMSEGFSDVLDSDTFRWTQDNDPMTNLHAMQKEPHAISGHIVVPGFAGGTANTEFDVLTGIQTNALSAFTTSAMRVVNQNLESLFRVFAADGYRTSYYHPGEPWFYNRKNVYQRLGAEYEVFAENMEEPEYKGTWITDDYVASCIEKEFETARSEGRFLFNYTTTIQNHMAYTTDKYGPGYTFPPISTTTKISDEAQSMLEVYAEGMRDADAMLGRLQAYFAGRSEPVVLAFFGDHLPYLGNSSSVYQEIGSEVALPDSQREDMLVIYKTPFVIWANDAAAELLDWETSVSALELPADGTISASFLGQTILELTGRAGESPWYDYLGQLRRELPVVQRDVTVLPNGTLTPQSELNAQQLEAIRKWRCWSYYKLKYERIS